MNSTVFPAKRATCGGDWCQTFAVSDDVLALSIGDVCGHGSEQFTAMSLMRQAIRRAALAGHDPALTLAEANRFICRLDPRLHATALFVLLDTRRRTMTFANAGHPPPLLVGRFGSRFLTGPAPDLPLGIDAALQPALQAATTPARSLLVLYTDGVTERERHPLAGEAQLLSAAAFAYENAKKTAAAVIGDRMNLTGSNEDDVSILTAWTGEMPRQDDAAPPRPGERRRFTVAPASVQVHAG